MQRVALHVGDDLVRAFLSGQRDVDLVQMAGAIEQPVQRAPIGQQLATCVVAPSPPLKVCVPMDWKGKGEKAEGGKKRVGRRVRVF
ncbi:hypothetical protein AVMA1855_06080 [Acidovorax sp. SUPP1855]|uniref:hypothetical protein n=1 Tax=Acidovorax sp. SUPP1855 TaxID=431774 RepID=UPI0023DE34F5|nr:hypothetical protein [Acidovorax sp. SUPP1855]GKS83690.1 hypothetical protein AVMA1855_06080 [Acidovorax sp. SUPP1855]